MSLRKAIEDAATDNSVAIEHQGSDLNALDELNADLSAGVVYQGSDLNYLELILAAIPSFVYMLNDDGTLAGLISPALESLPTNAPEYLVAMHTVTAATDETNYIALPASIGEFAPTTGTVARGAQLRLSNVPNGANDRHLAAGIGMLFASEGAPTGFLVARIVRGLTGGYKIQVLNLLAPAQYVLEDLVDFDGTQVDIGLSVDPVSGDASYTVGGGGGVVPTFVVPAFDAIAPLIYVTEAVGGMDVHADTIGKIFSAELIVAAADITEPMPSGTHDIYDAVIGA